MYVYKHTFDPHQKMIIVWVFFILLVNRIVCSKIVNVYVAIGCQVFSAVTYHAGQIYTLYIFGISINCHTLLENGDKKKVVSCIAVLPCDALSTDSKDILC